MCVSLYLLKGNVEKGIKEVMITRGKDGATGHTGHVLALAVSSDGMYLVRKRGKDITGNTWCCCVCIG